jgi:uncharacterized RDD family membrane protein YckC
VIVAADLNSAADGISRDIDELLAAGSFGAIVLTVIFGLPVASLLAMLAQRWLAVVPFAISLGLGFLWAAYYATDWFGPQSGPGMLALYVLITLGGWSVLALAVARPSRTSPS